MRLFKSALVAALISLSTCSTSCTREVPVEVPVPAPPCQLDPIPSFPRIAPEKCVDGETELVCLTPADAAAIWAWARDTERWAERAVACHGLEFTPTPKLEADPAPLVTRTELERLFRQLIDPRLEVTLEFKKCGFENAFYDPDSRSVLICTEMLDYPAVRFFLAHEVAHAYIVQLDVPFTGSHEAAADELAAVLLFRMGRAVDVAHAAAYWMRASLDGNVPGWADHPDNDQRYWRLSCLAREAAGALLPPFCRSDLARVDTTWTRLLK